MPSSLADLAVRVRAAWQSSSPAGKGSSGARRHVTVTTTVPTSAAMRVAWASNCATPPMMNPPLWMYSRPGSRPSRSAGV